MMNNLDTITIQNEEYRVLIRDGDYVSAVIKTDEDVEFSMTCEVFDVVSWEGDTDQPYEVEGYLKAYIKWDGCSHVWFGEEEGDAEPHTDGSRPRDGYLHLCGKRYWQKHSEIMLKLYELAENTITRFDPEVAD